MDLYYRLVQYISLYLWIQFLVVIPNGEPSIYKLLDSLQVQQFANRTIIVIRIW